MSVGHLASLAGLHQQPTPSADCPPLSPALFRATGNCQKLQINVLSYIFTNLTQRKVNSNLFSDLPFIHNYVQGYSRCVILKDYSSDW